MADSEDLAAAGQAATETNADVGRILRSAREAKGFSLEELAAELRLERRLILALEESRFDDFGAPVFAKGYLKQYGARLGLAYEDLLSGYYDHVGRTEVDITPPRTIKLHDERQITVWVIAGLAVALLAVFLFVWWMGSEPAGLSRSRPASESVAPVVVTAREAAERDIDATAAVAVEADASPAQAAAIPEPAAAADETSLAGLAADTAALPLPEGQRLIEVRFTGESWTEITDATGQRLYIGLATSGSYERMNGEPPVSVLFGNADAVDLRVDGLSYPLPRGSRDGNLARFVIDARPDSAGD
jgi:cytoskeleton protein RodZ